MANEEVKGSPQTDSKKPDIVSGHTSTSPTDTETASNTETPSNTSKQFDPSKVTNPLQLFALTLGAIVIAFITASTLILKTDNPTSWLIGLVCIVIALFITYLVIDNFQIILLTHPWVLFSPAEIGQQNYLQLIRFQSEYLAGKLFKSWQESTAAETANVAKKSFEDEVNKTDVTSDKKKEITTKFNSKIDTEIFDISSRPEQKAFIDSALSFEMTVREALTELPVAIKSVVKIGSRIVDFVLTKSDGSIIPVETKFVVNPNIINDKMLEMMERDMTRVMKSLDSKLSIVILSAPISDKLQQKMDTITKNQKIFFIDGITKDAIKIKIMKFL